MPVGLCGRSWSGKCGLKWIRCCLLEQADGGLKSIQPQAIDWNCSNRVLLDDGSYLLLQMSVSLSIHWSIPHFLSVISVNTHFNSRKCVESDTLTHTDELNYVHVFSGIYASMGTQIDDVHAGTGPYGVSHTPTYAHIHVLSLYLCGCG